MGTNWIETSLTNIAGILQNSTTGVVGSGKAFVALRRQLLDPLHEPNLPAISLLFDSLRSMGGTLANPIIQATCMIEVLARSGDQAADTTFLQLMAEVDACLRAGAAAVGSYMDNMNWDSWHAMDNQPLSPCGAKLTFTLTNDGPLKTG